MAIRIAPCKEASMGNPSVRSLTVRVRHHNTLSQESIERRRISPSIPKCAQTAGAQAIEGDDQDIQTITPKLNLTRSLVL